MIFYRIISILILPFLTLYIFYRALKGKENYHRIKERFGFSSQKKPQKEMVWIHAVSVGETNSSLVLLDELLKSLPEISIIFTTTTLTSATILANKIQNYNGRVIHQFLPLDSYFIVKKFLNFWQPKKIFFVESEIWPNFIYEAKKARASMVLVNGRMSEKSFSRWLFAKKIGFNIFDFFTFIFAQSNDDKNRFSQLTAQEIIFYGNLKSQALNLKFDEKELEKLESQINERPFWLASSTHKGEEEIIIAAHKELQKEFPNILTILVPRHPNRAAEIKNLLAGINFSQRSAGQIINNQTAIYLADSLGELGLFYTLSDFAFIGGSLQKLGGHNPFEAIKLNCAVISGKYVFNFAEIYEKLLTKNACLIVETNELPKVISNFLKDKKLLQSQIERAAKAIDDFDDIAKKIVDKVL